MSSSSAISVQELHLGQVPPPSGPVKGPLGGSQEELGLNRAGAWDWSSRAAAPTSDDDPMPRFSRGEPAGSALDPSDPRAPSAEWRPCACRSAFAPSA